MQSVGQRYYREKLARLLSKSTLLDVVGLTWSGWAIQNGHAEAARNYIRFPEITVADRRRVPIVLIDDPEYALQHTSVSEVFERLRGLTNDPTGWEWSLRHGIGAGEQRPYPFADELGDILPRIFGRELRNVT